MKQSTFLCQACVLSGLCGTLLFAPTLRAEVDEFGQYGDVKRQESPQNMAVEIRLGPYLPDVDSEFGNGSQPFTDHFGKKDRWMLGLELDWQLLKLDRIGSLGPGVGFGYTMMESTDYHDPADESDRDEAATGSTLKVLPFYAVAVVRIDALAKRTPVPVAFFGKAGIGYGMWWANYATSVDTADDGTKAKDTSWGTHWTLGAAFLLDSLDPRAANNMDATNGINNSYIFVEWYNSDLSGLGSKSTMQIGDSTWMAGLALEM
jgi:hypothetical protein